MTHPFINDLSNLTLDELQNKTVELTKKLSFASRMQNRALINQLLMALDSYKEAYQKKLDETVKKQNLAGQINIQKDR